jgi:hypothetical protein
MIKKFFLINRNLHELQSEKIFYKNLMGFPSELDLKYEKFLNKQLELEVEKYNKESNPISNSRLICDPFKRVLQKNAHSLTYVIPNPEPPTSGNDTLGLSIDDWHGLLKIAQNNGIIAARKKRAVIQTKKSTNYGITTKRKIPLDKYWDFTQIKQPTSIIRPYFITCCANCFRIFVTNDSRQKYCFPGCKINAFIEKRKKPHNKRLCPYCSEDISDRRSDAYTCGKDRCRKDFYRKKGAVRKRKKSNPKDSLPNRPASLPVTP